MRVAGGRVEPRGSNQNKGGGGDHRGGAFASHAGTGEGRRRPGRTVARRRHGGRPCVPLYRVGGWREGERMREIESGPRVGF